MPSSDEPDEPKVIVEPIARAAIPADVQRISATRPQVRDVGISDDVEPEQRGGIALVIFVYLLASGALAYAIYERFLA